MKRQPIRQEEWRQVLAFFKALHDMGFQHTDLLHNLYLSRGNDGKLQVMLLDFEKVDGLASDDEILQEWEKRLRWQNLLRESDGVMNYGLD